MLKRYLFGEWFEVSGELSAEQAQEICQKAADRALILQKYPHDKVLRVLERVGKLWADPEFGPRKELMEILPQKTGFSSEMLSLAMDEIVWMLEPKRLRKKMKTELRGLAPGIETSYDATTQTQLRWCPLGVVMHVLSGNVFLVGLGSLVEGLLTGNATLIKMSSAETYFMPRFMETLQSCDEDGVVSGSVGLLDFPSSNKDVIETLKRNVDGVLVWGGEEAVRAYRDGLSAGKKFIVYGPKLSLSVVTAKGMEEWGTEKVAERLALEVSVWDQNACTAPQLCYVQSEAKARELADALASALEVKAKELPAGPADINVAVEIQKMRGVSEIAEARGEGWVRGSQGNVDWTVVVDRNPVIEPSPLHRTIKLVPFEAPQEILDQAAQIRGYVQTIGLVAAVDENQKWYMDLSQAGALKVGELGKMGAGEIDDPHDGAYDLSQFGHFVLGRFPLGGDGIAPFERLSREDQKSVIDSRLRVLIDEARSSQYYGAVLEGITVNGTEDLVRLPVLSRELMETNMPPQGTGLATGCDDGGGYVSRSGGSTGLPKFSVYDGHDWDQMIRNAEAVLRGAGMRKGDRVANLMLSGDLYGSFVSFDHINCRLGAKSFAFASHADAKVFHQVWKEFEINMVQAIPARVVALLREVKKLDPQFQIEKVMYAGTPMSATDAQWLRAECGVKRIASVIGANDGGQLAYQCEHLHGAHHHLVEDFNYVELVDENDQPVKDGEPGRILITSLLKFAYPLIRYDLGDMGKMDSIQCPCGRNGRVMEYLGRSDDTVCVGTMNVRHRDMVAALDSFPVSALQIVISNSEKGELVHVNVETDLFEQESLARQMNDSLIQRVPKVGEQVLDGIISLEFELHAPGALIRNQRSGKLKTLVDTRNTR